MPSMAATVRRGYAAVTRRPPLLRKPRTGGRRAEPLPPRDSPVRDRRDEADERTTLLDLPALSVVDLEQRVHGSNHFLAICQIFPDSSSHQSPQQQHGREEASVDEQQQVLSMLLDNIEKSIVLPICLHPSARELFQDHRRRLDNYLPAAKNLVMLHQMRHPALASGRLLHDRAKSLLDTAMTSLTKEFCRLKIWRADSLKDHPDCLAASIWESVRSSYGGSCRGAAFTSASSCSWTGSSGSLNSGSSGTKEETFAAYYYSLLSEERTVQSNQALARINLKSLSILDGITSVMIEAGCEHKLRQAFDQHSAQLVRHIEILDIDNILGSHTEESKEMLQKVWTLAMRANIGVLTEMRRQLIANDFGSFNPLKEDYFLSIAKLPVMKLLYYASSICILGGPTNDPSCTDSYVAMKQKASQMVMLVMMYQALSYAMPQILALFSGQTNEILAEIESLINGLSAMFAKHVLELNDLLRSHCLAITDTGVHCLTRGIMDHLRSLLQQKQTVYMMLKGNTNELGQLVTQLISSLLVMLKTNSTSLGLQGQQQLFLLNNVHFMLEETNKHIDFGPILGESWFSQCRDELDGLMAAYVEASWALVMSSFEVRPGFVRTILWPHQLFERFASRFEMTYNVQKTWKVTDPLIRQKLREAVAQKVIPLYRMQMENCPEKKHKLARYNIEQLESELLEMFEG